MRVGRGNQFCAWSGVFEELEGVAARVLYVQAFLGWSERLVLACTTNAAGVVAERALLCQAMTS